MINAHLKILILILALFYLWYTGEVAMSLFVIVYYLFGLTFLKLFFKRKSTSVWYIYDLFFFAYGVLTLLTHIVLIKNPETDYYIHIDASNSFYYNINTIVLPCSWSELPMKTIFEPYFANYPIASFIMGTISKLGLDCGIENLRLYQRIHIFLMAALTPAIMASALELRNVYRMTIIKSCFIFGFFSYLWIGSCIFTRDMHVTFVYVLIMYVFLHPSLKYRFFIFLLLAWLATGMRPLHGAISCLYIFAYYYKVSNKTAIYKLLFIFVTIAIVLYVSQTELSDYTSSKLARFDGDARESVGVFAFFYNMPFPLDKLFMSLYMLIQPLPIQNYILGTGKTFLTLPFVISPYIMAMVFCSTLWYIAKHFRRLNIIGVFITTSAIVFFLINLGSPDIRRSFAAIPGIYVSYTLIKDRIPSYVWENTKQIIFPFIFITSVGLTFYTLL